jgi:hypothetical protein
MILSNYTGRYDHAGTFVSRAASLAGPILRVHSCLHTLQPIHFLALYMN